MIEATTQTFEQDTSTGLVFIDFYADWCAPCKAMLPTVEKLQQELPSLKVVKANVDELDEAIPVRFGVRAVPTFVLVNNGSVIGTKTGVHKFESLVDWVSKAESL